MRVNSLALVTAILLPAGLAAASAPKADSAIPAVLKSTVVIETGDGIGTGFFVGRHEVLTAAHVVAGADVIQVILGSRQSPGRVKRTDSVRDLALLNVDIDAPALAFPAADPTPGVTVFAVGDPLGGGISVTRGIVSGFRQVGHQRVLQTDASINPGNSGGPLVTEDGLVVGVVVSKLRNAEGIALAVPADRAKAFVDDTSQGETPVASARPVAAPPASTKPSRDVVPWLVGALGAALVLGGLVLSRRRRRTVPAPDIDIVLHPSGSPSSAFTERSG